MNKFMRTYKFVAFGLAGIIFLTSPLISFSQQKIVGELTVLGGANSGEASFVTINGESAQNGRSVISPAEIAVPSQTSAKIIIGKTGRVEFGPNSRMNLTFDENRVAGIFTEGLVTIAVSPRTSLSIQTVDGVITNPDQSQENVVIIDFANGKTRIKTVAGVASFNGALIPAGQVGGAGGAGSSIFSASIPLYAVIAAVVATAVIAVTVANSDDAPVSPTR
jgi:hypothetical protein